MDKKRTLRIGIQTLFMMVWVISCTAAPQPSQPAATNDSNATLPAAALTPTWTPFQPLGALPVAETLVAPPANLPTHSPTSLPTHAPDNTATPLAPSPTSQATLRLWIDPLLPPAFHASLALPAGVELANTPERANLRLEFGSHTTVSQWIYVLVAPFPTLVDGVSPDILKRAWSGETGGPFSGRPLLLDESTLAAMRSLWGEPAAHAIQVIAAPELVATAWKLSPSWALVPFDELEPTWKVLELDGQSPIRKDFDPSIYPLSVPISISGDPVLVDMLLITQPGQALAPASNRLPERLTVLAMTGVTALVRSTAYAMERKGIEYPAGAILNWLKDADLTHISNEVPFAEDCPSPDPFQQDMQFCSDPRYIGLMETVGTDIVELTGDHFQDWGAAAMNLTLEMYRQRGWLVYGGGANLEEARRAITLEHNGNRLAFIGCNGKGGAYAQAAVKHPGAAPCDYPWLEGELARLRSEGYLPIFTFQHFEYYNYPAQPDQKRDFRRMAQAGALIVSGSQAHQPQALEFNQGALIHYGLGNLFFDQYEVSLPTRQAFIDRHIFYNGRYISTELLSGMFVDYAKMRPMTPEERRELLQAIFAASGW